MRRLRVLIFCLLSAPVWADDTLTTVKDSFLTQGSSNRNEGANHILRLQSSGNNRVLVGFDVSGVTLTGLQQATLVLTISDISSNWSTAGRPVRAHRLLETFTEGNGWNVGNNIRGTGAGVTWKCATDDDIDNSATDCAVAWDGGSFAASTSPAVIHANGTTGEVVFDVTQDIAALGAGATEALFLVKKENEGQSGQVEYFSKEAALAAGDVTLSPRLILVTSTPNEAPTAVDDEALTATNRAVTVDVLSNDSDPNNDALTLVSVGDPANGSALIANGAVTYTPDVDFTGTESFTYTVEDTASLSSTATVTVTTGNPTLTALAVVQDVFFASRSAEHERGRQRDAASAPVGEEPCAGTVRFVGGGPVGASDGDAGSDGEGGGEQLGRGPCGERPPVVGALDGRKRLQRTGKRAWDGSGCDVALRDG